MKHIDADYYGYRDEDDGCIVPLEQEMEKKGMVTAGKGYDENVHCKYYFYIIF